MLANTSDKLIDEAGEVRSASSRAELIEELADSHEVLSALMAVHGVSADEIERRRLDKRTQYGGFDGRIYNEAVETTEDNPAAAYYLARADKYPRS